MIAKNALEQKHLDNFQEWLDTPIGEGSRNNKLIAAVLSAKDSGLDQREAENLILSKATQTDGLGQSEVLSAMQSGFSKPISKGDTNSTQTIGQNYKWTDTDFLLPIKKEKKLLKSFIETIFAPDDLIHITDSFTGKGHYLSFEEAKELSEEYLKKNRSNGLFTTINPLKEAPRKEKSGKIIEGTSEQGRTADHVKAYKYLLIEGDDQPKSEQLEIVKRSGVPYAAIVDSGNKSLHFWCVINAKNAVEYDAHALKVYAALKSEGLILDEACKNPNRLCRLPFAMRSGKEQALIELQEPKMSVKQWLKWRENVKENKLPKVEKSSDFAKIELPPKNEEIIEGILRVAHVMNIGGPSKAGKSFALINLGISLATGAHWMHHKCRKSKILHVDLEVERPSFIHRVSDVAKAKGLPLSELGDNHNFVAARGNDAVDILKGVEIYLQADTYDVLIIDPLFKIDTNAKENEADSMKMLFRSLNRMAVKYQCSIIIASHFRKGTNDDKPSMDKIAGSGVMGRDPDAILTLNPDSKDETKFTLSYDLREFKSPSNTEVYFNYPIHETTPKGKSSYISVAHTLIQNTGETTLEAIAELYDPNDNIMEDAQKRNNMIKALKSGAFLVSGGKVSS